MMWRKTLWDALQTARLIHQHGGGAAVRFYAIYATGGEGFAYEASIEDAKIIAPLSEAMIARAASRLLSIW